MTSCHALGCEHLAFWSTLWSCECVTVTCPTHHMILHTADNAGRVVCSSGHPEVAVYAVLESIVEEGS